MPSHDLVSRSIALFCHDRLFDLLGFLICLGLLHLRHGKGMLQTQLWRR